MRLCECVCLYVKLMSSWDRVQYWDGNEKPRAGPVSRGCVSIQETLTAGFPLDIWRSQRVKGRREEEKRRQETDS